MPIDEPHFKRFINLNLLSWYSSICDQYLRSHHANILYFRVVDYAIVNLSDQIAHFFYLDNDVSVGDAAALFKINNEHIIYYNQRFFINSIDAFHFDHNTNKWELADATEGNYARVIQNNPRCTYKPTSSEYKPQSLDKPQLIALREIIRSLDWTNGESDVLVHKYWTTVDCCIKTYRISSLVQQKFTPLLVMHELR